MEIRTLSHDFKLTGVLDGVKYLKYSECFRDAGELFALFDFSRKSYELLKPPARILIDGLVYTVEKISCSEEEISVWAVGIFAELKEQYIAMPLELEGAPSYLLYQLAERVVFDGPSYAVYGIEGEDTRASLMFEWCTDYYSMITQLCYDYELGFRILYNDVKNELGFYITGISDRASDSATEYTVISDRRDTYTSLESVIDISKYKTKLEFIYRINSLDELESYVYDRTRADEQERGYVEYPRIVGASYEELAKEFDALARRRFKEYRKRRYFKARLRTNPKHQVGNLCYVESTLMGESAYALLTEREIEIKDTVCSEALLLEVQE